MLGGVNEERKINVRSMRDSSAQRRRLDEDCGATARATRCERVKREQDTVVVERKVAEVAGTVCT